MRALPAILVLAAVPLGALAQKIPDPVPASEVFTPEQIGHALAAPTPEAGKTNASLANGNYADAEATYHKLMVDYPEDSRALVALARLYLTQNRRDDRNGSHLRCQVG